MTDMYIERNYRFRLYPTQRQIQQLEGVISNVNFAYNELLRQWIREPRLDLHIELDRIIQLHRWLELIDRSILTGAAEDLERICSMENSPGHDASGKSRGAFVRSRCRFRSSRDASAAFTIAASAGITLDDDGLTLGGIRNLTAIRIKPAGILPDGAGICAATITRNPEGQYHVILRCRMNRKAAPYGRTNRVLGLVRSLDRFCCASDPSLVPDAEFLNQAASTWDHLTAARNRLRHMVPESRNYEKQQRRAAVIAGKLRRQIRDFLHKLSSFIADQYDVICVETLSQTDSRQQSCEENESGPHVWKEDDWAEFLHMLEYKAEDRGKLLVKISDAFPSRRTCCRCGQLRPDLPAVQAEWTCPCCGAKLANDANASRNILNEGLRLLRRYGQETSRNGGLLCCPGPAGKSRFLHENGYMDFEEDDPEVRSWDEPFYITSGYGTERNISLEIS